MKQMRIGFLLGAGASLPAGMPCTEQLTEAVLHVESYQQNPDEYFEKVSSESCDRSWPGNKLLLQLLLGNLKDRCNSYFDEENKSREVNYEDIYFAASQLEEHLLEEYENPAIEPLTKALLEDLQPALLEHLRESVPQHLTGPSDGVQLRIELKDLAVRACHYIRSVVMLELRREPTSRKHLTCLVDAICDPNVEACDIFTLNHDLLIERVLHEHRLVLVDGFREPEQGMAEWDAGSFERPSRHYLLKLHGSIDWVDHPAKGLVKTLSDVWERAYDDGGDLRFPGQPGPKMLIGTFNKIRDYYGTPYFDLAATFRRQLTRINWLVVSGYSFGDKGINTALSEWMDSHQAAKILVLHERGDQCLDRARGAIRDRRNRMCFHDSHICATKWVDLRSRLSPDNPKR